MLVLVALVLISGCATKPVYYIGEEGDMLTFEVDHSEIKDGNELMTFTVENKGEDLFDKWQKYNELEMAQDRWDASKGEDEEVALPTKGSLDDDLYDCTYVKRCD